MISCVCFDFCGLINDDKMGQQKTSNMKNICKTTEQIKIGGDQQQGTKFTVVTPFFLSPQRSDKVICSFSHPSGCTSPTGTRCHRLLLRPSTVATKRYTAANNMAKWQLNEMDLVL